METDDAMPSPAVTAIPTVQLWAHTKDEGKAMPFLWVSGSGWRWQENSPFQSVSVVAGRLALWQIETGREKSDLVERCLPGKFSGAPL